jgi:hypothetical protein
MVWFPIFSAFRLYVGLHVSRHILCLHSVGVVAEIKGSDSQQNRRAYEPLNSWFDSRQGQSIFFFFFFLLHNVQTGCGAHLASRRLERTSLSSDEVTVATRSSF